MGIAAPAAVRSFPSCLRPLGWRSRAGVFLALAYCAVAGRLSAETPPVAPTATRSPDITRSSPTVGERLGFHGYWFGLPVGHGWLRVSALTDWAGHPAYLIEAEGRSNDILSTFYPIYDTVSSYLDANTLQPLRFEKHQREGRYHADEIVTFDYARGVALYRSLLNESEKTIPLTPDVQDLVSVLYWLRAQPLKPPQRLALNLYTDEKIYQTELDVAAPQPLELLKRGTFSCFVVEPKKASFKGLLVKRGRLWAYVTADAYRIPLLIKTTTPWGLMSAVIDEVSIPPEVDAHHEGRPSTRP